MMTATTMLGQHPDDVYQKTTLGKAIVSADHQIDIMTHKLWTVQNRMLEHRHAEEIGARPFFFVENGGVF